ncbi:MAG: TonB-dependent receptor [Tannerella sp.]|jgi:outer membrane receptor protein involved in Fe transport|nr:TonB-dependent receptor [Tannerella sp.]
MKKMICVALALSASVRFVAADGNPAANDSIRTYFLDEIVFTSSFKETNDLSSLPGSVSVLPSAELEGANVHNVKDLSMLLPNFFVPDYGSKMTSPLYVRGVGNRITSQASGMYVDHVPILNKAGYDFEFADVERVELLRGPQGTLFGRNSMGGLLNVLTASPLAHRKMRFSLTGGSHGLLRAGASANTMIGDRSGLSLSVRYERGDGYFTNAFTGRRADDTESAGGRLRFDRQLSGGWKMSLTASYDFVDQGAFPYRKFDAATGAVSAVSYNDEGSYMRKTGMGTLRVENNASEFAAFASSTSLQGLNDRMRMDLDYSAEDLFSIDQRQRQRSFTEELTLKSNKPDAAYRWLFGGFFFIDEFATDMQVDWTKAGVQSNLDLATAEAPVTLTVVNDEIPNPGRFDTPSNGLALYHQSTYNNLFVDGLSATAGIRLDYGRTTIDYRSSVALDIASSPGPPVPIHMDTTLQGTQLIKYKQILPRFVLKYEMDGQNFLYASAAKGFNPGGYNIQLFSELIMQTLFSRQPIDVVKAVPFAPEYSWTYETGYKGVPVPDRLWAEVALFYVDMADMQLAKYTNYGRLLENAGKAASMGVDIHLSARLFHDLTAGINYGQTHAVFRDYNNGQTDLKGNYLPFVPRRTFSVHAAWLKDFSRAPVDRIQLQAQYSGTDRIYWTETNDIAQNRYGLLNLRASVGKGCFTLNLWTKNTLDTRYNTFYFDMRGDTFLQQGKPFHCGADLVVSF